TSSWTDSIYERLPVPPPTPAPATAREQPCYERAEIIAPVTGAVLEGAVRFVRSTGQGVRLAHLWIGTKPGVADIAGYEMPDEALGMPAIPAAPGPGYVRIWAR